jgi:hypothetical protein
MTVETKTIVVEVEYDEDKVRWKQVRELMRSSIELCEGIKITSINMTGSPDLFALTDPDNPRHPVE